MKITTAARAIGGTPHEVRVLAAGGHLPGTIRLGERILHVPSRSVFAYLRRPAEVA